MPIKKSEPLINVLGQFLHRRFGIHIPATSWPMNTLPEYLKFRIVVKNHQGRKMISSRDPAILHRRISSSIDHGEFNAQKKQWERHGITRWDFEAIPNVFELPLTGKGGPEESKSAGDIITAYPGLSVEQNKPNQVSLCLFQEWSEAIKAHVMGVKTLATLHLGQEMKQLKRRLTVSPKIVSKTTFFGGEAKVKQQLFEKVTANLFAKNIRTKKAFMACLDTAKPQLIQTQQAILAAVEPVINAYHCCRMQLADLQTRYRTTRSINDFIDCRLSDLKWLVPKNFIALYDVERLDALPLFIEAVTIRAQRGVVDLEKDRRKNDKIKPFGNQLGTLLSSLSPGTSDSRRQAIESYFWLLEAFKVSVFAQELKVPGAISAKCLSEKLSEIDRMV